MLSRRYLRSHLQLASCLVTFTLLTSLCCAVRAFETHYDGGLVFASPSRQNDNNSSEKYSQGPSTGVYDEAKGELGSKSTSITDLPHSLSAAETSTRLSSNEGKATISVVPVSIPSASVLVTATQVPLSERMLTVSSEAGSEPEGSTETPMQDESSTEAPSNIDEKKDADTDSADSNQSKLEVEPSGRQSRYNRFHEESIDHSEPVESEEPKAEESSFQTHSNHEFQEPSTEYYKEPEVDGGDSYSDFMEDNELLGEQLPTPMALITPNGEGNNPPLEDDFAEAFKKVNGKGKRRRFRGGRRGRHKSKKVAEANDSSTSSSTISEHEETSTGSMTSRQDTSSHSSSTTSAPKHKRYRSTTPGPQLVRASASTISSTNDSPHDNEAGGNSPVIKHGPKPMILQHSHNNNNDNEASSHTVVTAVPQLEKPGNGGHTEKISTYFFSTPSPSSRIRLRQKIRESLPSTEAPAPPSPSTTTESSVDALLAEFPTETDDEMKNVWKNEFSEFPPNPFFSDTSSSSKFKIPDFVPINIGLESDDHQDPAVENALPRPDPVENKVYSTSNYPHHSHSSEISSSYDDYQAPQPSASTTPKSHKVRRPSRIRGSPPTATPEKEKEKHAVTEYYHPGLDSEGAHSFPSQRPTSGSHYDRTKDHVVFYNDSPYSTQHSPIAALNGRDFTPSALDTTPETTSKTVASHLSVSDGGQGYYDRPGSPPDHHYDPSMGPENGPMGVFTRGHVYPSDVMNSQIESTFLQNGPPDSSHIHSPNIVEHAHALPPPEVQGHEPHDLQNLHHPHHNPHYSDPHQSNQYHEPGAFPEQNHLEEEHAHHHHHHQSMSTPGVGDSLYGTVEPVSAHGDTPFDERHTPPYSHHPHHHMYPHAPPPPGAAPFNFGSAPPPLHSPTMPFHLPQPHHGEQTFDTHPQSPSHSQFHSHENDDIHNSVAPGLEMHAPDFEPSHFNMHHDSDHLAGSSQDRNRPHGVPPPHHNSIASPDGHASGSSSLPTAQSPPEFPSSSTSEGGPGSESGDPISIFSSGAAPPPQPPHLDQSFPPHSHTMASHADYEPANPPLPHDHPFHSNFFSFPSQDMHEPQLPDSNSISSGGPSSSSGSVSYHPGVVESVPTGRPLSFEPSALIPEKFTPIPDDVKETDLYATFANKPLEGESGPNEQSANVASESPVSSNQISDIRDNPNEPPSMFHGPPGDEQPPSYHLHHPHQHIPPRGLGGYSGPVHEIHAGVYHPSLSHGPSMHDGGHPSYHDHPSIDSHPGHPSSGQHEYEMHVGPPTSDIALSPYHEPPSSDHDITEYENEYLPHHPTKLNGEKKEKKKPQASFSNTPYVLMFPQLIPEEKMRPSPPSLLTKEIPVIQASSILDFGSDGNEKAPMAPGFKAVPVHPRHQMYQVLAKTHYEKMMERYRESKKKPPSAIYTPYGILVPVGTNVDAGAASVSHNVFAKPRAPPKFRGEKNLLTTLLGSSSSMQGHFQPPGMNNRVNKMFEYQPAIDALAEKLAMKIVSAQQAMNKKKQTQPEIEKKKDGPSEVVPKSSQNATVAEKTKEDEPTASASELKETLESPDLKDYLKGVLKGHLTEMVETSVSAEDTRRPPVALSTKLLNSFFRKGRISSMTKMPSPGPPPPPPPPIMMQASSSMMMPNKVAPPPGMLSQPMPSHHGGFAYPHPPPPGPMGLLSQIRRLFSFAPPEGRYEIGVAPNFAGRTLYTNNNGSGLQYIDGPSPRSSHFQPQIILPHSNRMHHQAPPSQQMQSRMSTGHEPNTATSFTPSHTIPPKRPTSTNNNLSPPTPKPSKKKQKKPSSPPTKKSPETPTQASKWPQTSKSPGLPTSSSPNKRLDGTSIGSGFTSKSNISSPTTKLMNQFPRSHYNNSNTVHMSIVSKHIIPSTHNHTSKPGLPPKTGSPIASYAHPNVVKTGPKVSKPEITSAAQGEIIMNKRISIAPSASIGTDSKDSTKPAKIDMFQTILGSTRSVLNFFKSSEARKSSGYAPTVLTVTKNMVTTVTVAPSTTPQPNSTRSDSH